MEIKKKTFDDIYSQKILNHTNPINLLETTRMFSQEDKTKSTHKKSYALLAGLSVIVVIVAVLLVPQGSAPPSSTSSIQLSLNYAVGQHMVYTQLPQTWLRTKWETQSAALRATTITQHLP